MQNHLGCQTGGYRQVELFPGLVASVFGGGGGGGGGERVVDVVVVGRARQYEPKQE
jgi:hypothetical protein